MCAAFDELDARSSHQIFHGAGDEDLAWVRKRGHACTGVHSDPSNLSVRDLALACMQPCADGQPDLPHALDDGRRAVNCPRGTVESG